MLLLINIWKQIISYDLNCCHIYCHFLFGGYYEESHGWTLNTCNLTKTC